MEHDGGCEKKNGSFAVQQKLMEHCKSTVIEKKSLKNIIKDNM